MRGLDRSDDAVLMVTHGVGRYDLNNYKNTTRLLTLRSSSAVSGGREKLVIEGKLPGHCGGGVVVLGGVVEPGWGAVGSGGLVRRSTVLQEPSPPNWAIKSGSKGSFDRPA